MARKKHFIVTLWFCSSPYTAGGGDGSTCMIEEDLGMGCNINVPWEHGKCGDADYIAVWNHTLIPVAEACNPDMILTVHSLCISILIEPNNLGEIT
ncbi:histone deacetylase 18-like [Asparagus officinalis]|uniref:histone deacetylase 18-like n=1 Tax=Asparagus officinalis TaxID=4686 RepID=UPI00098DE841|nr:histone deacetylase 18-like [Asparagus officinalis]